MREFEDNINQWCRARTPLLHGSRKCAKYAVDHFDLCRKHAAELWPHQLIDGVLYLGDGLDEEGMPETNPFEVDQHNPRTTINESEAGDE